MSIQQILIALLMLLSGVVLAGIADRRNMWGCIILYWLVLFAKNVIDFLEAF